MRKYFFALVSICSLSLWQGSTSFAANCQNEYSNRPLAASCNLSGDQEIDICLYEGEGDQMLMTVHQSGASKEFKVDFSNPKPFNEKIEKISLLTKSEVIYLDIYLKETSESLYSLIWNYSDGVASISNKSQTVEGTCN